MDSLVVRPGEGTTMQGPVGGPLEFKLRGEHSDGALTVLHNEVAPGEGPPLHTHDAQDETWLVLDGTLRFKLGDRVEEAPAGTFVFVPRTVPHAFQNIGDGPARIVVTFTPAGMEPFFDAFAQLGPGDDVQTAFRELGAGCGMTVVGPPLAVSDPR